MLEEQKGECPLKEECIQKDAIYHQNRESMLAAQSTLNGATMATPPPSSVKARGTTQHGYVWDNELGPDIEWSILQHAPAYRLGNRTCDLCLTGKVEIAKTTKTQAT